ncbi:MAG: V4R domain-containing protein [Desulfobacterales bacterium]
MATATESFSWKDLGNFELGRPNLGQTVPLFAYRLLQYTLRNVLFNAAGPENGRRLFAKAGLLAGSEFCRNMLNRDLEINAFIAELQRVLKDNAMGILRVEQMNLEEMTFVLTIAEDLDCSGLSLKNETVCEYDEGFLAGIFTVYTGIRFSVREVDCWATGDRVCRFEIRPAGKPPSSATA